MSVIENNSFSFPLRVYYEDTDAGGVVYHSQYLNFMERARTEALRSTGFEQDIMREQMGVLFVVHRMEIDFKKPARFNEQLTVKTELVELGRSLLRFNQQILRDNEPLIQAKVNVVCIDAIKFKPVSIPVTIKNTLLPLVAQ